MGIFRVWSLESRANITYPFILSSMLCLLSIVKQTAIGSNFLSRLMHDWDFTQIGPLINRGSKKLYSNPHNQFLGHLISSYVIGFPLMHSNIFNTTYFLLWYFQEAIHIWSFFWGAISYCCPSKKNLCHVDNVRDHLCRTPLPLGGRWSLPDGSMGKHLKSQSRILDSLFGGRIGVPGTVESLSKGKLRIFFSRIILT